MMSIICFAVAGFVLAIALGDTWGAYSRDYDPRIGPVTWVGAISAWGIVALLSVAGWLAW